MRVTEKFLKGQINRLANGTKRHYVYGHSNGFPRIIDMTERHRTVFIGDKNRELWAFLQGMMEGLRVSTNQRKEE